MTRSIGKSCLIDCQDRIVLSLRPLLYCPRCVLKPLILQEIIMVLVTLRQAPVSPLRRYWLTVVVDKFNFKQHTNGKTTVLFFWPMDFTFVCRQADRLR